MQDFNASRLADFVDDECARRLRAYEAQPRDANEHFQTKIEVLSGGYAYRQLFELIQNAADAIQESGDTSGRIYADGGEMASRAGQWWHRKLYDLDG